MDGYVTQYDASGDKQRARQLGTPEHDYGNGIGVDDDAHVYITGAANAALDGTILWSQQYGGPDTDNGRGIAVDNADNVYLVGSTIVSRDSLVQPGKHDVFLRRFARIDRSRQLRAPFMQR